MVRLAHHFWFTRNLIASYIFPDQIYHIYVHLLPDIFKMAANDQMQTFKCFSN